MPTSQETVLSWIPGGGADQLMSGVVSGMCTNWSPVCSFFFFLPARCICDSSDSCSPWLNSHLIYFIYWSHTLVWFFFPQPATTAAVWPYSHYLYTEMNGVHVQLCHVILNQPQNKALNEKWPLYVGSSKSCTCMNTWDQDEMSL